MNTRLPVSSRAQFARRLLALAVPVVVAPFASAQFIQTSGGEYDYNNTANWTGGTINNQFASTRNPVANQTLTFGVNTTLSSGLTINNTGSFSHTFLGLGEDRTLTLGGNISLGDSATNANAVTFGSNSAGTRLNIDLGGSSRIVAVGTNRTLEIHDVVSGSGGITKTGAGTLKLTNTSNTFTGGFSLGTSGVFGGTVEVTKLANSGQASSIGAGSSITFGGSEGAATLRYVGSGDSSNRTFTIGGQGSIFDSSGTGAIEFTRTNNIDVSPSPSSARTMTFTGTNTDGNRFAGGVRDPNSAQTSVLKQGSGRWILSGNNTFTGNLTIDAGTLELGSDTAGGNGSALVLNGGTFATGAFSETFFSLDVNGSATIDFGSNSVASALLFGNSSGLGWGTSVSLSIVNFETGVDSISFGPGGLTTDQLGKITINGFAAAIDTQGNLSAVPEPSAFAGLAGAAGLLAAATRRRRRA